jgi:predicted RNA binding protein YcfA (HicA-like mRNA interferase family)
MMGQLAGFTYKDIIGKLKKLGFEFDRNAKGSHEIWRNPQTRARTTIPNHPGDIPEGTVRNIIQQGMISKKAFLDI